MSFEQPGERTTDPATGLQLIQVRAERYRKETLAELNAAARHRADEEVRWGPA